MRLSALTAAFGMLCLLLVSIVSCDSYDCTLNNTVECKLAFYKADGTADTITDTLSILNAVNDSVLLNSVTGVTEASFPLSYFKDKDTLELYITDGINERADWIIIEKTNIEHFESIDCPVKMFHTITGVSSLQSDFIDSVAIISPSVEYNNGQNIKIYMHTDD